MAPANSICPTPTAYVQSPSSRRRQHAHICSVVAQEQGVAERGEQERENEAQERVQGRSHAQGADVVVVASLPLAACHRLMPIAC